MIDHDKSNIACGINLVMGEDGAFREAPDPYAILVFDTEEDWNALQDAVNRGNRMSWISVKDRLPNPGERVLATDGAFVGKAFTRANGWMRYEGIDWQVISSSRVTHCMPLPEPPKEAHHEKA